MDRKFVMSALGYALVGLALGIYMGISEDHSQFVTHAHIMLVGFVVSFVYAVCHKLWLNNEMSTLAKVQFYVHQSGALVMFIGLFLFYGNFISRTTMGPILGISTIVVFSGMALMKLQFILAKRRARQ